MKRVFGRAPSGHPTQMHADFSTDCGKIRVNPRKSVSQYFLSDKLLGAIKCRASACIEVPVF